MSHNIFDNPDQQLIRIRLSRELDPQVDRGQVLRGLADRLVHESGAL